MRDKEIPGTMECHRFHTELADYLEGEHRPLVTRHAQECPFCATVLADLEGLRRAAREIPLEEPSPVVWANIRAALAAEGLLREPQGRWAWLAHWGILRHAPAMGALASLAVLGVLLTLPPTPLGPGPTQQAVAPGGEKVVLASADDGAWVQTIQQLEDSYKAREPYLQPELKVTYRKSLDSLNGCIHECLVSLKTEPSNTLAREYLQAAYSQKAELLTTAMEFSGR